MKGPDAFRTISEVATELDLPQHVLRFWETRFSQIKPMKRGGGRRYYRPDDVYLLRGIRLLLYAEGYTIKGVQRLLRDKGVSFVASVGTSGSLDAVAPPVASGTDRDTHGQGMTPGPGPSGQAAIVISEQNRSRLESVLTDMLEAKRILDHARN